MMSPQLGDEALAASPAAVTKVRQLRSAGFARWLGITLFFSVASIIQTWPLALHLDTRIVAWRDQHFDSWMYLWNLWWVKHALLELHNPFHTNLLYFPQGTDLYLHTLAFVNGVLSIPLQLFTGNLVLSWNALGLTFLVVSGLGMYALSHRVTGNHVAALVSGYIFAFAPYVLMRFAGHWDKFTTWPIPLFFLFLLRLDETTRLREAVAAGICWSLLTYNTLEYGAWAGISLALFFAYYASVKIKRRDWAHLRRLCVGLVLVGGVWFVASAPLLIPTVLAVKSGDYALIGGADCYSADLLALVTRSPLWGAGTGPVGASSCSPHVSIGSIENTVYLGIVPLLLGALAFFALRRSPHQVLFWALVFLFFTVVALGPHLYVGETKTFSLLGSSFSVPLPYQLYDQLPLVGVGRTPARMIVFALVGLAVLAGTGFDLLMSWLRVKYRIVVPLATVLVLGLVVLDYWNPPVGLYEPEAPAILKAIGDEPGDFTVLNVPWGRNSGGPWAGDWDQSWRENLYQTLHGKPGLGGSISRAKQADIDWVWQQPGLRFLACARCTQFFNGDDMNPDVVRNLFRHYKIKYVVLRWGFEGFDDHKKYLQSVLGLTEIYTDPIVTVFRDYDIN